MAKITQIFLLIFCCLLFSCQKEEKLKLGAERTDSYLPLLKEKKIAPELPDDLTALIRNSVAIRKHLETNHKDQTAKRGLTLTESKIKALTKHYKKTGKLASEWKFDPERAGFFTK